MAPLLERNRTELLRLCRDHHVKRVDAFGSVVRDDFDAERSDIDLLVEFDHAAVRDPWTYVKLHNALEALLGRPVGLAELSGIDNPLLRAEIEATRRRLDAA